MHTQRFFKSLVIALIIGLIALLTVSPILSQGNGNGNGGNGGNGGSSGDHGRDNAPGQVDNPGQGNPDGSRGNGGDRGNNGQRQSTPAPSTSDDTLLGCQKNNPDRLDCSSLEVGGVCEADTAVFTIRNTGEPGNGDMVSGTEYRLIVDGVIVETGTVQLLGGETMEITYSGGGTVTLEADQQVGHPGHSEPRTTLHCAPSPETTPTVEPTPVPTDEPTPDATDEPTPVPTDEPTPDITPYLTVDAYCSVDGYMVFVIANTGGSMTSAMAYEVTDPFGLIDYGQFVLVGGESFSLQYIPNGDLTLTIIGTDLTITINCDGVTPVPTEEPTPDNSPYLTVDSYCSTDGYSTFVITNIGGDMVDPAGYEVTDAFGLIDAGQFILLGGESFSLQYMASGDLSLNVAGGLLTITVNCDSVTPVPTDEPTPVPTDEPTPVPTDEPTPVPTDEPTPVPTDEPTPVPTDEPTPVPTDEPTPVPTDDPTYQCQNSNPDRLDCSSLQVTGMCVDGQAVFTITNTGEAGNGDMVMATEYRLVVDGAVIEFGAVQLAGGETTEVIYDGGGTVTLEADQQIGHPGKSHPRSTLHCSP